MVSQLPDSGLLQFANSPQDVLAFWLCPLLSVQRYQLGCIYGCFMSRLSQQCALMIRRGSDREMSLLRMRRGRCCVLGCSHQRSGSLNSACISQLLVHNAWDASQNLTPVCCYSWTGTQTFSDTRLVLDDTCTTVTTLCLCWYSTYFSVTDKYSVKPKVGKLD